MSGLPGPGPSNRPWFVPHLYLRPRYMYVVTPLGSLRIDAPPEEVAAACALALLACVLASVLLGRGTRCCFPCCCVARPRLCRGARWSRSRARTRDRPRSSARTFCETLVCGCNEIDEVKAGRPRPVLVLTDIGRDIDDTLAMLALNGLRRSDKICIVGVVTCGGAAATRARVARGWLRRFGLVDDDVPVVACPPPAAKGTGETGTPECHLPGLLTPALEQAAVRTGEEDAADLILKLARVHAGELEIFALSPLTPLHRVLDRKGGARVLREGVRTLYIQGQYAVDGGGIGSGNGGSKGGMVPDFASYNMREDKVAARRVFTELLHEGCGKVKEGALPKLTFRLLGKHAAYAVSLTKEDFVRWDSILQADGELLDTARSQMDDFRRRDPELFYKLYPIPEGMRTDKDWFDACKGRNCLCRPYDPLLVLSAFQPKLFRRRRMLGGSAGSAVAAGGKCRQHAAIGNAESCSGVKNAAEVHDALCALIREGLEGCAEQTRFPKLPNTGPNRCCYGLFPACSVHHFM